MTRVAHVEPVSLASRTQTSEGPVVTPTAEQPQFSPAAWQWLQKEEKKSAGENAAVMTGVLLLALVGYAFIVVGTAPDLTIAFASFLGVTLLLALPACVAWVSSRLRRETPVRRATIFETDAIREPRSDLLICCGSERDSIAPAARALR